MHSDHSEQHLGTMWQKYTSPIAWGTIVLFIGVFGLYFFVVYSAITGALSYLLASAICIYLCFACFTIQHEAVHGSIISTDLPYKFLENWLGWLASFPLLISPFKLFQRIHERHHAFTNDPEQDPDHFSCGNKWYHILMAIYIMPFRYHWLSFTTYRHIHSFRQTYFSTLCYLLLIIMVLVTLVLQGFAKEVFLFAIVPNVINIFILVLFFDYIPHHPHTSLGKYHNTRINPGRLLNILLLGQNYHLIHHLYPRVPWYKYQGLFNKIDSYLTAHGARVEKMSHGLLSGHNTEMNEVNYVSQIHNVLKVSAIKSLSKNTVAISFALPDGQKLAFSAGQYITISKWLSGSQTQRCYSICSHPQDSQITIAVKEETDGLMSKYLNNTIQVGDELVVQGPFGDFIYPSTNDCEKIVLIAGGSGISPIMSIMRTILTQNNHCQIHLLYACKDLKNMAFKQHIEAIHENHRDRIAVDFFISVIDENSLNYSGRLTPDLLVSQLNLSSTKNHNTEFYICGPQKLNKMAEQTLLSHGIPASHMHIEKFITEKNAPIGPLYTVNIHFGQQHKVLEVAANQSVLEVAKAEHIPIAYACQSGSCGSCICKVDQGSTQPLNHKVSGISQAEQSTGITLACQCKPTSDLVITVL